MRNIIRTSHEVRRRQSVAGVDSPSLVQRRDSMPQLNHQLSFGALKEPIAPRTPPVDRLYRQHTEVHPLTTLDTSTRQRIFASKRAMTINSAHVLTTTDTPSVDNDVDPLLLSKRYRRAAFARRASRSRMSSDSADTDDGASISYVSVTVVLLIVISSLLIVLLLAYFVKR